ncbi:hypothetical protein Ancab_008633 [Ancistrocladus abbreviatus]
MSFKIFKLCHPLHRKKPSTPKPSTPSHHLTLQIPEISATKIAQFGNCNCSCSSSEHTSSPQSHHVQLMTLKPVKMILSTAQLLIIGLYCELAATGLWKTDCSMKSSSFAAGFIFNLAVVKWPCCMVL